MKLLHGCPRCWGNLEVCAKFGGPSELACESCGIVLEGRVPELWAVLRISEVWYETHEAGHGYPDLFGMEACVETVRFVEQLLVRARLNQTSVIDAEDDVG